jgi:hypothetical protein
MQAKRPSKSREAIYREIAQLGSLPVREVKQPWRSLYRSEPPHRVSRELLTRAVALPDPGTSLRRAVSQPRRGSYASRGENGKLKGLNGTQARAAKPDPLRSL